MKKTYILILSFILFLSLNSHSQELSISDLINLQSKNLDYINNFLTLKSWEFHSSDIKSSENKKTSENNDEEENSEDNNAINTSENTNKITTIEWSYNKSKYNNKAEAWLYLYEQEGFSHSIGYQTNKINFNKLKNTIQSYGFKLDETAAEENALVTRYKNDKLEIIFITLKENKGYSYENDLHYLIKIINYKEIEDLIALVKETEMKAIQEKFKKEQEEQQKEENYQTFINKADKAFENKDFVEAKKNYIEASKIKTNENYPINKIEKINKIIDFLSERKYQVYNYKEQNILEYNKTNSLIIDNLKKVLNSNLMGNSNFNLTYYIDTLNKTTLELKEDINSNKQLINTIRPTLNNINLTPILINGYSINAKAEYDYSIAIDRKEFKVRKNFRGIKLLRNPSKLYENEILNLITTAPTGKFKIEINKRTINNNDFSENKIISYRGKGGASNMILSILVPGLGDKYVMPNNHGLAIGIFSYALIGGGIISKLYSEAEYIKYKKATNPTDISNYKNTSDILNYSFYALVASGSIIWLTDIIKVAYKGAQNSKANKSFKKGLGLSFNVNMNSVKLAMNY
ncbi:MAG: hypothetical protein WCH34_04075 [Bacteroidota bacterium]